LSQLITELKSEHKLLLETLETVKNLGITTKAGREKVHEIENLLLSHLEKEDSRLYPELTAHAENHIDLKEKLELFAQDMAMVSGMAIDFFEKYKNIENADVEFAKELGALIAALKTRINKEEAFLYAEYEKINL